MGYTQVTTFTEGQTLTHTLLNTEFSAIETAWTGLVETTGAQTIAGIKTFTSIPVLPAVDPTAANQAVRRDYLNVEGVMPKATTTIDVNGTPTGEDLELSIAANSVAQGHLKTASVILATATTGNITVTGAGAYAFWPQVAVAIANQEMSASVVFEYVGTTSYVTNVFIDTPAGGGANEKRTKFTYIQASGEVYWIFILIDKATKEVLARTAAPDHVCFGNGGKPMLAQHPFNDVKEKNGSYMVRGKEVEIIVINPSKEQVDDMEELCIVDDELEPDLDILGVLDKHYEIDYSLEPPWPSEPVTVGLPKKDEKGNAINYHGLAMGTKINPIRKVIPKPDKIKTARLEKK